jgi:hypothetical protein
LLAGIDAIGDAFGAQFELVKKFESFEGSMANLLFDPKEVKDKADKSIKEAELALEKTKSDYAQAQLDIRAFDKKSAEDAKKIHEEKIKKIIEENQKLKQDLKSAELDKPFQGLNFGAQKVIDQLVQANIYMQKFKANTSSFVPPKLESPKLTFSDDQLERFKLMKDSANALNDAFKNAAAEGISTFAFALGTALVEGGKGFDNMFQTILSIVAKASVALGNAFIAMGLASQKVKDSLFSDPYMAIAAGAALVVAGGVAQAVIKNMGAKKMEQGGLVYGNSFVNVGEYGNAHTNPEVIAPLSKLKDMIGGSNTQRVMVEGRLYGSQLAMASSRSQSVIKRVTGRR